MNNIFEDELMAFNTSEFIINNKLMKCIFECEVSYINNSYITESEQKSLITHLKEFFDKIITAMNNFKNAIRNKLEKFKSENSLELRLRNARKKLMMQKEQGEKYIENIDVFEYKKVYVKMVDDLWKEAKRFPKVKYNTVDEIDRDLLKFDDKIAKYDEKLDEIEKRKVKIKIDDAIEFVSREIGGNTQIMKTIEECELKVREMDRNAQVLAQRRNILGADIIPKHVSLIKRIVNSITKFIRNKVSKFISIVVFLCAV